MLWKIYFWIYLILSVIGSFVIVSMAPLGIGDSVSLIFSILLIICLYGFSYNKKLFTQKIWNIIFWLILALVIEGTIELLFIPKSLIEQYFPFWKTNIDYGSGETWLSYLISLPAIFAAYKLTKVK